MFSSTQQSTSPAHPTSWEMLLAAFILGAETLALEVLASRIMIPVVGSGPLVWAALLASALGSMAIGNVLGGIMVRRISITACLSIVFVASALACFFTGTFYTTLRRFLLDLNLLLSAITGSLMVQAIPMLLAGVATPFILECVTDIRMRGRWNGMVLCSGSLGGIVGATTMALYVLPSTGLCRSYLFTGIVLIVAIPVLFAGRRKVLVLMVLPFAAMTALISSNPIDPGAIQSRHGEIRITTTGNTPALLIDGMLQTALPYTLNTWSCMDQGYYLEYALLCNPGIRKCLAIGLGAGLAPRIMAKHNVVCKSVEIDAHVARIAAEIFRLRLPIIIDDGRRYLSRSQETFDLVFIDVCTSEQLAWHLFSFEALNIARRRLSDHGIIAIQIIGHPTGEWTEAAFNTVSGIFTNTVLLCNTGNADNVGPVWIFGSDDSLLPDPKSGFAQRQHTNIWIVAQNSCRTNTLPVISDDHFPVERQWAQTAREWRRLCSRLAQ